MVYAHMLTYLCMGTERILLTSFLYRKLKKQNRYYLELIYVKQKKSELLDEVRDNDFVLKKKFNCFNNSALEKT